MKMIKSYNHILNNWSFGFTVDSTTKFEDLYQNKALIFNSKVFSGCSGYTKVRTATRKFFIQVPINYIHPKYRSEAAIKQWQEEMVLLGGNATFLGVHPWAGGPLGTHANPTEGYNRKMLKDHWHYPCLSEQIFMKDDLWATFELRADLYQNAMRTYHSFCLLRYLWSWHYMKIVDVYYDIKRRLSVTKPEPIEMLQLAFYSFNQKECENTQGYSRYFHDYAHPKIESFAFKIMKWSEVNSRLATCDSLNTAFMPGSNATAHFYSDIFELVNQRKYKAAYDKLKA